MNILITGGAGYVGSIMTEKLLIENYNVSVLDNLMYNQNSLLHLCNYKNFNFIKGDARNKNLLDNIISKFDIIIPLAALVGAPACSKNPKYAKEINLNSILYLLKIKSKNQILIYPNTNSGYGIGKKERYCTEKSSLTPISLYGKLKVKAEHAVLACPNTTVFRLATVFGMSPRMRLDLLVNNFVYRAITDGYLVLYEEHFRRNYIHIRDVANAFYEAIFNNSRMKGEVYNLGLSSANLTKRELAEKIKEYVPDLVILSSEIKEDPDKRDYVVNNRKLENTGWVAFNDLDDGIKELIKGYKILYTNQYKNI